MKPKPTPAAEAPSSNLRDHLRTWRLELAREQQKPAFTILHDRVIDDLSSRQPATLDELAAIPGIGPAKLARYGDAILRIIAES